MKAAATEGKRESIVTDHILRILGMDVSPVYDSISVECVFKDDRLIIVVQR